MLRGVAASLCSPVALAPAAIGAATITIEADQLDRAYVPGETIVLTITADPQGGKDIEIFGRLVYSSALTSTHTSSQSQLTRRGGTIYAVTGVLQHGDGFADVFNQIIDTGGTPETVDNILIATATLIADAAQAS